MIFQVDSAQFALEAIDVSYENMQIAPCKAPLTFVMWQMGKSG